MSSSSKCGLHLPSRDQFIEDFLSITEDEDVIPQEESKRAGLFDHFTQKGNLGDKYERTLIDFLHKEHRRLKGLFPNRGSSAQRYFDTTKHLVSFTCGLIKYLPKVLLNQLENFREERSTNHRLAVVQLLHLLTSVLYQTPNRNLYETTFFTTTKNSSEFSLLVFETYRRRTLDISPLIRSSFLEIVDELLSTNSQVPCWLLHNFAHRLHSDPNIGIRVKALTILNELFSGPTANSPSPKNVLDDKLLDRLALACLNSESGHSGLQQMALIVATKAYICLMTQYPAARPAWLRPDSLGRLAGLLRHVFPKTESPTTRAMVLNFMKLIKVFLREQEAGEKNPLERYLENELMTDVILGTSDDTVKNS